MRVRCPYCWEQYDDRDNYAHQCRPNKRISPGKLLPTQVYLKPATKVGESMPHESERLLGESAMRNIEITKELAKVRMEKDSAYHERNQLVAALSRIMPSHMMKHQNDGRSIWDPDWKNVVCIHGQLGQMAWHIHDSDMPMFLHIEWTNIPDNLGRYYVRNPSGSITEYCRGWDGHTTEEKYRRLEGM